MWNNIVPGIGENFYNFSLWFLVYGIMGWIVETLYISFCNKKLTNRGFIHGPICPIYGFGGILVHSALRPFSDNVILIFIFGLILATFVEYMAARLMIRAFGCLWWDYSNKPFNYKGIICLESSVAWGLYAVAEFAFIKNIVFMGISRIPVFTGKIIVIAAIIYYFVDFTRSVINIHRGNVKSEDNNILQFRM